MDKKPWLNESGMKYWIYITSKGVALSVLDSEEKPTIKPSIADGEWIEVAPVRRLA